MAGKKKDKRNSFNEAAALPFSRPGAPPHFPLADYSAPNAGSRDKAAADAEAVFAAFTRSFAPAPKQPAQAAEPASPASGAADAAAQIAAPAEPSGRTAKSPKPKPHYEGHRHRLRERFLAGGGRDMPDYELLELLLFRSVPRSDTKPLAKDLLKRFGSLGSVFAADQRQLMAVKGSGEAVAADLKLISLITSRDLYAGLPKRDVFQSWDRLIKYCRSVLAFEQREQFRVLFLDKKNGLIGDEILQTGTVDHTPVYPREVVKRALDNGASAIILVHNHPSGDPEPSRQDILMTKQLEQLLSGMNIAVYDHLIIGRNGYASLREMNLM